MGMIALGLAARVRVFNMAAGNFTAAFVLQSCGFATVNNLLDWLH